MRRNIGNVVALILRRRYWIVQLSGCVSKSRINEPSLSLARPDIPAIPGPSVCGSAVPVEMSDVAGFEVDSVPVMRPQDRDSCEEALFASGCNPHGQH